MGSNFWTPCFELCRREIIRFWRQPARIAGAIGTPIIFWAFLGFGLGSQYQYRGASVGVGGYAEYFFPGALLMVILFASIFTNISIIEDRKEGLLQGILISPTSRLSILLGKLSGGTLLAFFQGTVFLMLAPVVHLAPTLSSILPLLAAILLLSFVMCAVGFVFAWRVESTQGFHSVMNLVLMPMWLLSGALFPMDTAPVLLRPLMWINPATHGLTLLRSLLTKGEAPLGSLVILLLWVIALKSLAVWMIKEKENL